MKTKLDFTKDKLNIIVLELAHLNGYQKPSTYLDDLLEQVKAFNSFDFECELFLNIYSLCKENSNEFWSDGHKQNIIKWLKKSPIMTDVFDTTFHPFSILSNENKSENKTTDDRKSPPAKFYALLHKIKIKLKIEPEFVLNDKNQNNKQLIVKFAEEKYNFKDGQSFYRSFINETDLDNLPAIAIVFGKGYKSKLIRLSNNDYRIINELKSYPN